MLQGEEIPKELLTAWNELIRALEQQDFNSAFTLIDRSEVVEGLTYAVTIISNVSSYNANFAQKNSLMVDTSVIGVTVDINIPTAVEHKGQFFEVKKTDQTNNLVKVSSVTSIDTTVTWKITVQNDSMTILSDGLVWKII